MTAQGAAGVEIHAIVKIIVGPGPEAALTEIHVPGEQSPEVGSAGIGVDIVVFGVQVHIPRHGVGGHEIDHLRGVQIIEEKSLPGIVIGKVHADEELVEVAVVLEFPAFLLRPAGRIGSRGEHIIIHLVEHPILVQPSPLQIDIIAVLRKIIDPIEVPIQPAVSRDAVVGGHAGFPFHFVGQFMAQFGFVRKNRQEIDVLGPGLIGIHAPFEAVSPVAINVITFLEEIPAGSTLAVQIDPHVVVELPMQEN